MYELKTEDVVGKRYIWISYLCFLFLSLWISCSNLSGSGPLWPDSAQYANAAAMIHDWLLSGDFLHPYQFATRNYAQYPAFHLPYHPPVYPALLGLFFTITGVSYTAARFFVALSLWAAACFFYRILRKTGCSGSVAFWSSVVFLTIPEIAFWSRDSMSEVPSLALILGGSYYFLDWLDTGNNWAYVMAFGFAEAAFLSRYLTAGILPAWLLWTVLARQTHRLRSLAAAGIPAVYLIVSGAWVLFTRPYSIHETASGDLGPSRNYGGAFSPKVAVYFISNLPAMLGWVTLLVALGALAYGFYRRQESSSKWMWLSWFLSYFGFVLAVGIYDETRYFIFAMPAFAGWIASLLDFKKGTTLQKYVAVALVGACLVSNLIRFNELPQGTIGHEAIAQKLASLSENGNILIAIPAQAQVIFSYRSYASRLQPKPQRSFIRADRTLAVRPPSYTNAPVKVVARNPEDVLQIIQRGRIRYVVVSTQPGPGTENSDELRLLKGVLKSNPSSFNLLEEFPLGSKMSPPAQRESVAIWKYTGELPQGPSEIPVLIPTADLSINPGQ